MGKRMLPVSLFLILSALISLFSQKISTPFDFISHLSSFPRAFLYSSVHAETKPTELDLLKQENTDLRAKLVKLSSFQADNSALRSQFEDTILPPQTLLPAKAIGFMGTLDKPTELLLDQGGNSGIKEGMAVVSGHILIGKIKKVTPWNCELVLTVSKKFSTLGSASGNGATGVVSGEEDFILFDNVVITDTLSKGETVVSKGEVDANGVGIPADLIIGEVVSVNKSESSPFQSAFIKTLINFKKLTTVFIVTR